MSEEPLFDPSLKKKKKKSKKKKLEQTEPPTIGLSRLFPHGEYPEGEIQEYKDEYVPHPFLHPNTARGKC